MDDGGSMTAQFRIIFSGNVLPGFDAADVKRAAETKLKANAEQVERLFSGKRAVLKKNLEEDKAQHYVAVMRRIGMEVAEEEEADELAPIELPSAGQAFAVAPPVAATAAAETYDPEKTELADPAMVSGY